MPAPAYDLLTPAVAVAPPPLPLAASPRRLGRYELLRPIAAGGMGVVHLARVRGAAGFERLVAAKCLHAHLRADPAFVAQFLGEARLAALVRHGNVVATLDVGAAPEPFLVMEHIEGAPLLELARTHARHGGGPLPVPVVLRVVADVLAGLGAVHDARGPDGAPLGIVHRDVSPQNVLVGADGVTRVADFGVATTVFRSSAEARAVDRGGCIQGKLGYLAPELLHGAPATTRSDLFAAGVMLWELLTHRRLYRGRTEGETAGAIMYGPPAPSPARLAPAGRVPDALAAVVLRALARAPEERFATARDFAEALEQAGVALASPRQVGALVARMRQSATGACAEEPTIELSRVFDADTAPTRALTPTATRGRDAAPARGDGDGERAQPSATPPRAPAPPRRARGARLAVAAVAATLGVAIAGGAVALRSAAARGAGRVEPARASVGALMSAREGHLAVLAPAAHFAQRATEATAPPATMRDDARPERAPVADARAPRALAAAAHPTRPAAITPPRRATAPVLPLHRAAGSSPRAQEYRPDDL